VLIDFSYKTFWGVFLWHPPSPKNITQALQLFFFVSNQQLQHFNLQLKNNHSDIWIFIFFIVRRFRIFCVPSVQLNWRCVCAIVFFFPRWVFWVLLASLLLVGCPAAASSSTFREITYIQLHWSENQYYMIISSYQLNDLYSYNANITQYCM